MRPRPLVHRPGHLLAPVLIAALALGAGCGSGQDEDEGSARAEGQSEAGPPGPPVAGRSPAGARGAPREALGDDWYTRRARARQPELVAWLETRARAVADRPEDVQARSDYGWALLQLGRIEESLVHLRRAVELSPDDALAQRRLGQALYRDGQHEEASVRFQRTLELSPGDAEAHFFLAAAQERLGRLDAALEHFRLAREAAPENPDARYREALLVLDVEPEKATRLLEEVLALDPFHPGAALNLARRYRTAGRRDEAQVMLRRHQEIGLLADLGVLDQPLAPRRFSVEAEFYARQEERDEALAILERGIERHPGAAALWVLRARLLLDSGEVPAARAALAHARELAGDGADVAAGTRAQLAELSARVAEIDAR